ncbi:MAG: hypothetical protein COB45_05225 [Gammaproteobacteria bacterium]|nr:MAG: hypothetical protein COB45_05225 [Gammaproteobacteria bacterium]
MALYCCFSLSRYLMIKLFIKVNIVLCFFISSFAYAALITTPLVAETDTTRGNYITYQGLDIAWASSVNSERMYLSLDEFNALLAPSTHTGWGFATTEQWDIITALSGSELLALFTRESDKTLIQAFEYWNTVIDGSTDVFDIANLQIRSNWSWSVPALEDTDNLTDVQKTAQFNEIISINTSRFDTFYVRQTMSTPVPEPTTLMIFSLGLIALVSRKKLSS